MSKKTRKSKDIDIAKHSMWLIMKESGLLVNGHFKVGEKIPDKKKAGKKKACRNKINHEDC